ncbi:MAG: DUF1292 domain-containing protein [Oscillospiraceae bacterium]|jgi:uncharacterized protein YrzB (UPF0473 family)|nr:DUF1292 domain-containing protein [Oscillospiraceae bacterium]MBQ5356907.1 DUF1292 domain-containing protein [Oscillospiraceae bacterium]MBQ5898197.1 DUF1292 domain-containing protein [Oscillospiraceae bacterium]
MPQDFEEFNVITLSDDEGNEVDFELVDAIEHNGKKYCILYPEGLSEEEREDEEPLILEYVLEGDEDFLEEIIDDDEYDEIYNIYFGGDYES